MREVTLHSSPDSMGGAKRFPNTRVPVSLFFLNLAEGVGIERFCRGYPRVDPEDCRRVLAAAQEYMEERDEPPVEHKRRGRSGQPRHGETCFGEARKQTTRSDGLEVRDDERCRDRT